MQYTTQSVCPHIPPGFAPTHVKGAVLKFAQKHDTKVVELALKQYYFVKKMEGKGKER